MKDPSGSHFETDLWETHDWPGSNSLCHSCLEPWPCDTWKKWTGSKDYKIQQLQTEVSGLRDRAGVQWKEIENLRNTVARLDAFVQGIYPALGDLMQGKIGGSVTVGYEVEDIDVANGLRIAGMRSYNVDYESPTGESYHNGRLVGREYRKR